MDHVWVHPRLGKFENDGPVWAAMVSASEFSGDILDGVHEVTIETADEDEPPTNEAAELAIRVLANLSSLQDRAVKSLWRDFRGKGPSSGMWWRGRLEDVRDAMGDTLPLDGPDDLAQSLELERIAIRPIHRSPGGNELLAELRFAAPFEAEHGVGILIDGAKIVGIGYAGDVRPFQRRNPSPSAGSE